MHRVAVTVVLSAAMVAVVSGDCPQRPNREDWEHSKRAQIMAAYDKYAMRCPNVDIALFPIRIQMEKSSEAGTLELGVQLNWNDPGLSVDAEDAGDLLLKMNADDIWCPSLMSAAGGRAFYSVRPSLTTRKTVEANLQTGQVTAFFWTSLRGFCRPNAKQDMGAVWPRDYVECSFFIQPSYSDELNLTQHRSIAQLAPFRKKRGRLLERMSSWKLLNMDSEQNGSSLIRVVATLQRLPAQLETEVVHPMCLVSALVPASAALPPWSRERPALLATAILLHAALLLSLSYVVVGVYDLPRNLVLYRDAGLLTFVVVLQWLVSMRLASRKRPLSGWLRFVSRGLATLRTPLLLPLVPKLPQSSRYPIDEEGVGLSEVLDRLTLLSVSVCYLAVAIVSLQ